MAAKPDFSLSIVGAKKATSCPHRVMACVLKAVNFASSSSTGKPAPRSAVTTSPNTVVTKVFSEVRMAFRLVNFVSAPVMKAMISCNAPPPNCLNASMTGPMLRPTEAINSFTPAKACVARVAAAGQSTLSTAPTATSAAMMGSNGPSSPDSSPIRPLKGASTAESGASSIPKIRTTLNSGVSSLNNIPCKPPRMPSRPDPTAPPSAPASVAIGDSKPVTPRSNGPPNKPAIVPTGPVSGSTIFSRPPKPAPPTKTPATPATPRNPPLSKSVFPVSRSNTPEIVSITPPNAPRSVASSACAWTTNRMIPSDDPVSAV